MKTLIHLLAASAFIGVGVGAKENPSLRFDSEIDLPALSLLERTKESPVPSLGEAPPIFPSQGFLTFAKRRLVSKMPVIAPSDEGDHRLRIVRPDESLDHKLIVKPPEMEGTR